MWWTQAFSPPAALLVGIPTGLLISRWTMRLIQKLPLGNDLRGPITLCHACHHPGIGLENLPLLGYLQGRGHCSACGASLQADRFWLELFLTALSILVFVRLPLPLALEGILATVLLLSVAVVDHRHWIIPDLLVGAFAVFAVGVSISGGMPLKYAAAGTGIMGLLLLFNLSLYWVLSHRLGLGWGDIKLILVAGFWLGPILSVFMLFLAALLAVIFWLISGRKLGFTRKRPLQFGPFLASSTLLFGLARLFDPELIRHLLTA